MNIDHTLCVCDFVTEAGIWDWEQLSYLCQDQPFDELQQFCLKVLWLGMIGWLGSGGARMVSLLPRHKKICFVKVGKSLLFGI